MTVTGPSQGRRRAVTGLSQGRHRAVTVAQEERRKVREGPRCEAALAYQASRHVRQQDRHRTVTGPSRDRRGTVTGPSRDRHGTVTGPSRTTTDPGTPAKSDTCFCHVLVCSCHMCSCAPGMRSFRSFLGGGRGPGGSRGGKNMNELFFFFFFGGGGGGEEVRPEAHAEGPGRLQAAGV